MKGSSQRDMSLGLLSLGLVYKHNQSIERTICSLSFHNTPVATPAKRVAEKYKKDLFFSTRNAGL
jgi:hypothetical protein